jgi:hydrogenase nickel incorporation protein HypA/HybF
VHELGIAEAVLDALERRAEGRPVASARVRVGALLHVHEASFAQSFALVAEGSVAAGAEVELVVVPAELACRACGRSSPVTEPVASCPVCGAVAVELRGGYELVLERLAYRPAGQPTG